MFWAVGCTETEDVTLASDNLNLHIFSTKRLVVRITMSGMKCRLKQSLCLLNMHDASFWEIWVMCYETECLQEYFSPVGNMSSSVDLKIYV